MTSECTGDIALEVVLFVSEIQMVLYMWHDAFIILKSNQCINRKQAIGTDLPSER